MTRDQLKEILGKQLELLAQAADKAFSSSELANIANATATVSAEWRQIHMESVVLNIDRPISEVLERLGLTRNDKPEVSPEK